MLNHREILLYIYIYIYTIYNIDSHLYIIEYANFIFPVISNTDSNGFLIIQSIKS